MSKKTLPAILNYSASLRPSFAVMLAVTPTGDKPIPVRRKGMVGTQSQYFEDFGREKWEGNPQKGDDASLPADCDTLAIEWSMSIAKESLRPRSCDLPVWAHALRGFATHAADNALYLALGRRYAVNIANGRWAWRNLAYSLEGKVTVAISGTDRVFEFDAFAIDAVDFDAALSGPEASKLKELGDYIGMKLAGHDGDRLGILNVRGEFKMARGATVYPSQEYLEDNQPGKTLAHTAYQGEPKCASMHADKIGNAIRTIDTWHGGLKHDGMEIVSDTKPLAIEPYAISRDEAAVVRPRASGRDLYSLMQKSFPTLSTLAENDQLYVLACLVRGGVYNMKNEKAK